MTAPASDNSRRIAGKWLPRVRISIWYGAQPILIDSLDKPTSVTPLERRSARFFYAAQTTPPPLSQVP
jgi:hypothetical protein